MEKQAYVQQETGCAVICVVVGLSDFMYYCMLNWYRFQVIVMSKNKHLL